MEKASQKTFDQLDIDEKVRAVLGTVYEPITRDLAFSFSGFDYDNLSTSQKAKVDAVFNSSDIDSTSADEGIKYQLNEAAKQIMADSVDLTSVHKQITDKILEDLGGDEAFGFE